MHQRDRVAIVGAGAAGIGMAVVLKDFGVPQVRILDRYGVGSSFERWPGEMRLITPSFNTTPFGILDLNAVCLNTSVANFLGTEHPTGEEYARYLQTVASAMELSVIAPCDVSQVWEAEEKGFVLETENGLVETDFLIWATGEFQYPKQESFAGAEHCLHNSSIASYRELAGEKHVVIGAFESGADAAVHLTRQGRQVVLLNAGESLATSNQDPSRALSPFTRGRLKEALENGDQLQLEHKAEVTDVEKVDSGFVIRTRRGQEYHSPTPPILATGFRPGTEAVESLFEVGEEGEILLTEQDESTLAPGLFLAGPLVRHDPHIFCYIYKFRQRFAIIAEAIADEAGIKVPEELLEYYEKNQMRLADLSCCGTECAC